MRIKKLLALSLIASMLMSPITSHAEGDVNNYTTDSTSGTISIGAVVEETYLITMPALITLVRNRETGDYEGTYTIGVKADLLTRQKLKVAPRSYEVGMCKNGSGYYSAKATITQPIDTLTLTPTEANEIASDSSQYVEITGSVLATRDTFSYTGSWGGGVEFLFSLTRDPAQG